MESQADTYSSELTNHDYYRHIFLNEAFYAAVFAYMLFKSMAIRSQNIIALVMENILFNL